MKLNVLIGIQLTLLAYTGADCDVLERFKVKLQWRKAIGVKTQRLTLMMRASDRFFRENEETVPLFRRVQGDNVYSPKFLGHVSRVVAIFNTIVCSLDDQPTLDVTVSRLRDQHTKRGIQPHYFDKFGASLFAVLEDQLGSHFDLSAWRDCFGPIIEALKPRATLP